MVGAGNRTDGTSVGEAAAPAPVPPRDRSRRWFAGAAALGFAAALLVVVVGPGYEASRYWPTSVLVWASVAAGVAFGAAAAWRPAGEFAPERLARPTWGPRHHRERVAFAAVAATTALVLLLLAGSCGAFPGWYLPSGGATSVRIAGCGAVTAAPATFPGYPRGFSPTDLVDLRWETANGTEATVDLEESSPLGGPAVGRWSQTGYSGLFVFYGSGGPVTVDAAPVGASCPHAESVDLDWTYSAVL